MTQRRRPEPDAQLTREAFGRTVGEAQDFGEPPYILLNNVPLGGSRSGVYAVSDGVNGFRTYNPGIAKSTGSTTLNPYTFSKEVTDIPGHLPATPIEVSLFDPTTTTTVEYTVDVGLEDSYLDYEIGPLSFSGTTVLDAGLSLNTEIAPPRYFYLYNGNDDAAVLPRYSPSMTLYARFDADAQFDFFSVNLVPTMYAHAITNTV